LFYEDNINDAVWKVLCNAPPVVFPTNPISRQGGHSGH
jgi:hypothetical protein